MQSRSIEYIWMIPRRCFRARAGHANTGRVYVFDGIGYQAATPRGIAYYYSPDRKGVHPANHLATLSGVMNADGYDGYGAYAP